MQKVPAFQGFLKKILGDCQSVNAFNLASRTFTAEFVFFATPFPFSKKNPVWRDSSVNARRPADGTQRDEHPPFFEKGPPASKLGCTQSIAQDRNRTGGGNRRRIAANSPLFLKERRVASATQMQENSSFAFGVANYNRGRLKPNQSLIEGNFYVQLGRFAIRQVSL